MLDLHVVAPRARSRRAEQLAVLTPIYSDTVRQFYDMTIYPRWHVAEVFGVAAAPSIAERMRRQYRHFAWPYAAAPGLSASESTPFPLASPLRPVPPPFPLPPPHSNCCRGRTRRVCSHGDDSHDHRMLIAGAGSGHQVAQALLTYQNGNRRPSMPPRAPALGATTSSSQHSPTAPAPYRHRSRQPVPCPALAPSHSPKLVIARHLSCLRARACPLPGCPRARDLAPWMRARARPFVRGVWVWVWGGAQCKSWRSICQPRP